MTAHAHQLPSIFVVRRVNTLTRREGRYNTRPRRTFDTVGVCLNTRSLFAAPSEPGRSGGRPEGEKKPVSEPAGG